MLGAMIARVFAFAGVAALAACGDGGSSGPDAPAADAPIDADPLGTIERVFGECGVDSQPAALLARPRSELALPA